LHAGEGLRVLLLFVIGYPVAVGFGQFQCRHQMRPVTVWLGGDRSDPLAAWQTAQGAAMVYARTSTRWASLVITPAAVVTFASVDLTVRDAVAVATGFVWLAAILLLVVVVGFDLLFLPIQEEAAQLAPIDAAFPAQGTSLIVKIMGAVLLAAWSTTMLTLAVTSNVEADERFFVASLAVVPLAAYIALVLWTTFATPILRPLRELRAATRRVSAGDFSRRVPPTTTDEMGELVASFNAMQHGLQERAALHAAFGTYVDPGLAERVLAQGDAAFAGEEVAVTVFFVDVRGFTTYAEAVAPKDAFALLNRLFTAVVPVVREHGGHPNRYLGDGLLAVFGAPVPMADHADRALAAACEIETVVRSSFDGAIRIGVGLNSGSVIAGTIGGGGKLEYTVIGDVVNVAARVEQLTKETGDGILLTEATMAALTAPSGLADRGVHDIRGKAHQVRLYAVTRPR
ncbi:MAG: adenylate/guanylate cyclase domain-containing protein, partial [Acidimicrobiales bacterium]